MIYLDAFKRSGLLYVAVEKDDYIYGFDRKCEHLRSLVAGQPVTCFNESAQIMTEIGIPITAILRGPQPLFPAAVHPDHLPFYTKTRNLGRLKDWRLELL